MLLVARNNGYDEMRRSKFVGVDFIYPISKTATAKKKRE